MTTDHSDYDEDYLMTPEEFFAYLDKLDEEWLEEPTLAEKPENDSN